MIHEGKACTMRDGAVSGEYEGTYEMTDGTDILHLTIGDVTYTGKIINMTDEAGNETLSFMAVGSNNHTLWGVKYLAS